MEQTASALFHTDSGRRSGREGGDEEQKRKGKEIDPILWKKKKITSMKSLWKVILSCVSQSTLPLLLKNAGTREQNDCRFTRTLWCVMIQPLLSPHPSPSCVHITTLGPDSGLRLEWTVCLTVEMAAIRIMRQVLHWL